MTCWVTLGYTLGNAQALFDRLADTVQEKEDLSVDDTRVGAEALVDVWADTLPEMQWSVEKHGVRGRH